MQRIPSSAQTVAANKALQDYRVQSNRAYLVIVLLSRVITKLGEHNHITGFCQTDSNGDGFMPAGYNIVRFYAGCNLLCSVLR